MWRRSFKLLLEILPESELIDTVYANELHLDLGQLHGIRRGLSKSPLSNERDMQGLELYGQGD